MNAKEKIIAAKKKAEKLQKSVYELGNKNRLVGMQLQKVMFDSREAWSEYYELLEEERIKNEGR